MSIDFDAIRETLKIDLDGYLKELLDDEVEEIIRARQQASHNRVYRQSIIRTEEIEADIIGDDDQLQIYSDELDIKINQETSKIWGKYKL